MSPHSELVRDPLKEIETLVVRLPVVPVRGQWVSVKNGGDPTLWQIASITSDVDDELFEIVLTPVDQEA